MALHVLIAPPILIDNEVHDSTEYKVYTDEELTDLVHEHTGTDSELLEVTLDYELTANESYYVTVRFIFDPGGLQGMSLPVRVIGKNSSDGAVYMYPPRTVNPPNAFPMVGVLPPGYFRSPRIELSDYELSVKSVTWLLEDRYGKVKFFSTVSSNMESILIDKMLPPDAIYILKASLSFENGTTTMLNYGFIEVGGFIKDGFKVINMTGCDKEHPTLITNTPDDFKHNIIRILSRGKVVSEFITDESIITDTNGLTERTYIVEITAETNSGEMIGPIFQYISLYKSARFPYCLPYRLG